MNTIIVTQNEFSFNVKFKVDGSGDDFNEMLSDFKSSIGNRKWNPTLKVWEVSNVYEKPLKDWCLISEWWDTVEWCGQILKAGTYQTTSEQKSYQSEQKSYQSEQKSFKSSADNFEDFTDLDPIRKEKDNLYNILYLTPEAPIELVEKVWKMLMILHHPDKGGDTARAAAINAAYQKIKENRK